MRGIEKSLLEQMVVWIMCVDGLVVLRDTKSSKQCTYMILQISKVIRTICLFNVLFVHLHCWKQWICIVFSSPGTGLFSENARHFSYEQLLHTSIPYRYIGPFIKAQHNSDLRNFSNRSAHVCKAVN